MDELSKAILSDAFLHSTLIFAIPLTFAALGGLISERAGVMNIGLEGMMLMGCFGGVLGSVETGSPWGGAVVGFLLGAFLGLILAIVAVSCRADQVVSGIGVNLLALGLTGFLATKAFGVTEVAAPAGFSEFDLPVLADIPWLGQIVFHQTGLFYVLLVAVAATGFIMFRTRWGLTLRATGESGAASATLGIRVLSVRYLALIIGGGLAGLGGVFIALVQAGTFDEGMTGGRGFIAYAVVIFASWRPGRALLAALLFGAIQAMSFRIQIVTKEIPFQLVDMLPYVVTLVVITGLLGRTRMPGSLGIPLALERRGG
jgi:ABC-type uncharacterized transport system permease subunit